MLVKKTHKCVIRRGLFNSETYYITTQLRLFVFLLLRVWSWFRIVSFRGSEGVLRSFAFFCETRVTFWRDQRIEKFLFFCLGHVTRRRHKAKDMFSGVAESRFVEYRSAVNRRPSRLMQGWNCEREIKFWLSRQQSSKVFMGGREGGWSPRLMYFGPTFQDWNHKQERTWIE